MTLHRSGAPKAYPNDAPDAARAALEIDLTRVYGVGPGDSIEEE